MHPLRAVLVERATPRLVELLAAALDGTGPAIAPLDAGLPRARLAGLIDALRPGAVVDTEGVTSARSGPYAGVAEGTAVVVGTSGSTGVPKGVELSAAALRHSARASLDRVGARPGQRWLCCLPVTHVAGLAVLVRSLAGGTAPVLAERADAETVAASGCAHVWLVPHRRSGRAGRRGPADGARPGGRRHQHRRAHGRPRRGGGGAAGLPGRPGRGGGGATRPRMGRTGRRGRGAGRPGRPAGAGI